MGVNQAENSSEDRLVHMIKDLQRQVLDLRTRQKVSADSISIKFTRTYTFGPLNIAASSYSFYSISLVPNSPILTIWNFETTVFVDNASTAGYQFPGGTSLSAGQKKMRMSVWLDWYNTDDIGGSRNTKIVIENTDTVAHDYYVSFNAVSPTIPAN